MSMPTDRRQTERVREQFTRTAEVFGDYSIAHRLGDAEMLARIVRAGATESALDVACGPGTLALRFSRHVRSICGLDLTPAILERARLAAAAERLGNLSFALGDAQALPFADGSLDIAVTSYSLHHMPDPAGVIREMARVVKPGGRVGVIDIRVSENAQVAQMSNRIERIRDASHIRTLARSEFGAMFAAAGLHVFSSEIRRDSRQFDNWMHVAGWHRGDREYIEARGLLESTMPDNSAGFDPQWALADPGGSSEEPDIHLMHTILYVAAEKP
jgi:ubiquinone/menaquinone biosynthesis C-methylase UbiE